MLCPKTCFSSCVFGADPLLRACWILCRLVSSNLLRQVLRRVRSPAVGHRASLRAHCFCLHSSNFRAHAALRPPDRRRDFSVSSSSIPPQPVVFFFSSSTLSLQQYVSSYRSIRADTSRDYVCRRECTDESLPLPFVCTAPLPLFSSLAEYTCLHISSSAPENACLLRSAFPACLETHKAFSLDSWGL